MRVNEDYQQGWNVDSESQDPDSVLNFWIEALRLRKLHDVFVSIF